MFCFVFIVLWGLVLVLVRFAFEKELKVRWVNSTKDLKGLQGVEKYLQNIFKFKIIFII